MATDSLVLQLQRECLDNRTPLLDVLRKALVVAKKLGLSEFQTWTERELGGYGPGHDVPEYRVVTGQLRAWNPMRGWIPTIFNDAEVAKRFSERAIGQPVGELEALLRDKKPESSLIVPLPPDVERSLMECGGAPFQASLHVNGAAIQGILDQVRTSVLNWCLDLEKAGILGEGMAFSADEKRNAAQVTYQVVYHGPVSGSQIQQGTEHSQQTIAPALDLKAVAQLVAEIRKASGELGLPPKVKQRLSADLSSVEAQLQSPEPGASVIRECLQSVRNIIEGCAGSVIASGLLQRFGTLLG